MKVYVVTTYEGDEPSTIVGVFSTRETADGAAFALGGEVEERELDPDLGFPEGMRSWSLYVTVPAGDIVMEHQNSCPPGPLVDYSHSKGGLYGPDILIHVWARDKMHAREVARPIFNSFMATWKAPS